MPSEYEIAHQKYRDAVKRYDGGNGDPKARPDKAKAMQEIVAIEREAAKAGTILSAEYKGDKVVVRTDQTDSKRSLQEAYVRDFDNEVTCMLPDEKGQPKEQTLREYHRKRLLNK